MCIVENCNNRNYCKGYCDKHFKEWKKYGKPLTTKEKCQIRLNKYDSQIEYIEGYIDSSSKVKCYCHRCNNYFERVWSNLLRHNTEYCCPICQTKLGLEKSSKHVYIRPLEERKKGFIEKLKNLHPNLTYINGFENDKSFVLVECNKCKYRFSITTDRLMRKNANITCKQCCSIETNRQREIKKYIKDLQIEHKKERKKILSIIRKMIKDNTLYIKHCKYCNKEYFTKYKTKTKCDLCNVKKSHSNKSLQQLYERDKGICYICNKKCDYEDYVYRGNTFIAGNYYPSIDHVIPLCKGGTDEWDNLKLAHRICNSYKGGK